jgi:transcription initiation factor TFIIIB Brf1 subunit/transcription initiation factor TFIIB
MSEINIFEKAFNIYDQIKLQQKEDKKNDTNDSKYKQSYNIHDLNYNKKDTLCIHINIINDNNIMLCVDCGQEIQKNSIHEKEWRYYGQSDTKHVSDPNRVQSRKYDDKNIFKDVDNMGFSDKIIMSANNIYTQVTGGKIKRGNSRKAIIFACIFHAYKLAGVPQTHEKLIQTFSLSRKAGLQGIKHVNLNSPKDSNILTTYITPENLIDDIMNKFQANEIQKNEVLDIYRLTTNKSTKLNRARPASFASGVIYYWICKTNKNITLKEFTKQAMLSELTINKMANEVSEIIKKQKV